LVEGEGAAGSIKIEQVRALRREAVLAPYEGSFRVYVLRRMDEASVEAANSLLKLLEEPPAHVVLALTTMTVEALPPTIVSRCQRLDLRPASRRFVEATLCERDVPQPKAQLLASLSGGRVGWALSARQDDALLRQREQDLDRLIELLAADRVERLDFAAKASQQPATLRRQIELWISWWRDLLLVCGQGERGLVHVDRLDDLRSLADRVSLPEALAGLRTLQTTAIQLEANVNPRLALEGLLMELPQDRRGSQGRVS
jgi:DNA polymerase-3 subunit delta'